MRHSLANWFLLALVAAVTACGPIPVYHREGTDRGRVENDTLSCMTEALKQAPVANEIRHTPDRYYPGARHCVDGKCWTRPGYWVQGTTYTVDVNLGLRKRLEQSCMAQKGYQQVPLQRCSQAEVGQRLASEPQRQPVLTEGTCVWRSPDGQLHILPPI